MFCNGPPVPKVVLRGISVKRTAKMPPNRPTCQKTVMDAMDSLSDGGEDAGDLMEEVYQLVHDTRAVSPRMHGRAKAKHKEKGDYVCHEGFISRSSRKARSVK